MRMIKADDLAQQMIEHRVTSPVKKCKIGEFDSMFGVPVVDAEEVVRCKDCDCAQERVEFADGYLVVCGWDGLLCREDGFCYRGKAKGNALTTT